MFTGVVPSFVCVVTSGTAGVVAASIVVLDSAFSENNSLQVTSINSLQYVTIITDGNKPFI